MERATSYGFVGPAMAAGYLGGIRGEAGSALALTLLGVAMLALRLRMAGVLPSLPSLPRGHGRGVARVASVGLVAALLVGASMTGALGPAAVDGASAQTTDGNFSECTADDAAQGSFLDGLELVYSPYTAVADAVTGQSGSEVVECKEQVSAAQAQMNETQTNLYESSLAMADSDDQLTTTLSNTLQNVPAQAWTDAEIEMIRAYNNGKTEQEVMDAGNESINQRYAIIERNILTSMNSTSSHVRYVEVASQDNWTIASYDESGSQKNDGVGPAVANYQLTTGVLFPVLVPNGGPGTVNGDGDGAYLAPDVFESYREPGPTDEPFFAPDRTIRVRGPNSQSVTLWEPDQWFNRLSNIRSEAQTLKQENVVPFADNLFQNYDRDELDVTDVTGATELAQRAGSDLNSTGANQFAATQLAALGYSTDLSKAFQVELTSGETLAGSLLYEGDDLNSWETGKIYDPSSLNGTVVMAVQDGNNSDLRKLDTAFSLEEMTNTRTGEQVTNTTIKKTVYKESNSNLTKQIDRLIAANQAYQNMSSTPAVGGGGGGGGGSGFGDVPPWAVAGGLAAAIGLVAYIGRQNNGGGRRAS
jgi:hypothetical protein